MCRMGEWVFDRSLWLLPGALLLLTLTGCAGLTTQTGTTPGGQVVVGNSTEGLIDQAQQAYRNGQLQEALSHYQRVLSLQPDNARAHLGAGQVLLDMHRPASALPHFEGVLQQSPDSAMALEGRGFALIGLHRFHEAEATLQRVVQINPGRWRAWSGLGILADLRRDFATAQQHYRKALLVLPDHPLLLNNRAFSLMMLQRYPEAEALLREAVRHAPDDVRILNNLAWCLAAQQHYDEAYKLLSPHIPPAMASNNIGYVAMLQGDYPAAVHFFNQALVQSPVFYERAANNLAEAQRLMKRSLAR